MSRLRAVVARLAGHFAGHRADDDLRDELLAHLEMETAENIRRGMAPAEARRQALLASGGLTQAAEAVRDRRGFPGLEHLVSDLRYAARTLRRSPGFSLVVIVTLALGIGANTAIFSMVRGVLLKPLPNRAGDRLVYLRQSTDGPGGDNVSFSVPEVQDFRAGVPALEGIAEYSPWFGTVKDRQTARIDVGLVTGNFFEVMGLSPILGRVTRPGDDGPGVPPVMVLTYDFWRRHFGGDSSIVGQQVRMDGGSVTVIGVLEPAPFFPTQADAFLNMVFSPHHLSAQMLQNRTHRMTEMVARLAPGATVAQARSEATALYARLQRDNREAYDPALHYRIALIPFKQAMGERARLILWLLMAAAAFVLVIAAANVANLTLMRGVRREHELVTRAALGAGMGRLRRLLLVENLLLTLIGSGLGALLALGGIGLLARFAARFSPRAAEIRLDGPVLAFALGLALALALLLAFVAVLPREGGLAGWIAAGGRGNSATRRKQRMQRTLVVAQVAVSVVLLAGAGLLTRTMLLLSAVDTGLRTEHVLALQVPLLSLAGAMDPTAETAAKGRYALMREAIAAIPGVLQAGLGSTMPLEASPFALELKAESHPLAPGQPVPKADYRTASPEYFRSAGIPLLAGREFTASDRAGAGRVAIINQTLARRLFPSENPLGQRIAWTGDVLRFSPISGDWRTIVGVVGDTRDGGPGAPAQGVVFQPWDQEIAILGVLTIRTGRDMPELLAQATAIVRRIAPDAPIEKALTVAQIEDESVAPRRLNAVLVASFSLLALLIAAVGIAGVLAFSVSARTTEIGIRMSLGAGAGRIQRMVLREGGVLLALGLVLGIGGAFLVTGLMHGLLFGVAPHDPATFLAVAAVMSAIGIGACWIPARRAAGIQPVVAMRAP